MRPYQTFRVLEDLRHSVSVPLRRGGDILTDVDRDTTLDVYQQWLLLCVDLGYLQPETLKRDGLRLMRSIVSVDILHLNNGFAECLQAIRLKSSRGFKALCQSTVPHLYHLIKDDVTTTFEGDVFAARRLIQLFSYTSRLTLKDIDLTQQMLDAYLQVEENIPFTYPENIVHSLNKILRKWIGPFLTEEIVPHHGPGGVAKLGRCSLAVKYRNLATDPMLEYAFGSPWWINDSIDPVLDRCSKTIFVPKSYKTFRTISMEPASLQYFQQGVWDVIDSLVTRNKYLRNHIDFHDSSRNRMLAAVGSITRQYATIDLSSASDSVGYDLVKRLFKGTWLLRYIVTTRSTHTLLPDGRKLLLKKFAPMGSSLCFPIETLIFAAICEHVTRVHHVSGDYSVYGDDIIVPVQCTEALCRILSHLGFTVNTEKSYSDESCWFRESCGGEFVDGFDVTPVRVSRKYMHADEDVRASKWIALANAAYLRGYRNLRYFFIKKLRDYDITPLYSPSCLLSDNYTNYHTKKRWSQRLQRTEVKVTTFPTVYEHPSLLLEDIRYRHWLESAYKRRRVVEPLISRIRRSMVQKRRAWVGAPESILDQDATGLDLRRSTE